MNPAIEWINDEKPFLPPANLWIRPWKGFKGSPKNLLKIRDACHLHHKGWKLIQFKTDNQKRHSNKNTKKLFKCNYKTIQIYLFVKSIKENNKDITNIKK